ncbi:hypothetical protein D3C87_1476410 [compost metagenome]
MIDDIALQAVGVARQGSSAADSGSARVVADPAQTERADASDVEAAGPRQQAGQGEAVRARRRQAADAQLDGVAKRQAGGAGRNAAAPGVDLARAEHADIRQVGQAAVEFDIAAARAYQ